MESNCEIDLFIIYFFETRLKTCDKVFSKSAPGIYLKFSSNWFFRILLHVKLTDFTEMKVTLEESCAPPATSASCSPPPSWPSSSGSPRRAGPIAPPPRPSSPALPSLSPSPRRACPPPSAPPGVRFNRIEKSPRNCPKNRPWVRKRCLYKQLEKVYFHDKKGPTPRKWPKKLSKWVLCYWIGSLVHSVPDVCAIPLQRLRQVVPVLGGRLPDGGHLALPLGPLRLEEGLEVWRQLYKNRSSRKIDSRRLFSRE